MQLIETVNIGPGGASSIQFNSIPQTFTDLKIVISFRGTSNELYEVTALRFNGINANLSSRTLEGNGSAVGPVNNGYIYLGSGNGANTTANTFSNIEAYIPNYTSSNYKSVNIDAVGENRSTTIYMQLTTGLWSNTSEINSIQIVPTGNFVENSTASLYGISSVPSSPKATGGIISEDSSYWYHMFPFSSTFTPTQSITADVLVIAGGGSGGYGNGGAGGGAGGYRTTLDTSSLSLTASAYTVTVGAGGVCNYQNIGNPGSNSSFAGNSITTISSTGGGGGSSDYSASNGQSGGSGGGGMLASTVTRAPGSGNAGGYTPVEGYAGGTNSFSSGNYVGAGGGGAGGVGGNIVNIYHSGSGGIGRNTNSAWAYATGTGINGYYAGGGAGAAYPTGNYTHGEGGAGGGGIGQGPAVAGTNGKTNTGSGGGGGGGNTQAYGGNGGSGIVIVRYAK